MGLGSPFSAVISVIVFHVQKVLEVWIWLHGAGSAKVGQVSEMP